MIPETATLITITTENTALSPVESRVFVATARQLKHSRKYFEFTRSVTRSWGPTPPIFFFLNLSRMTPRGNLFETAQNRQLISHLIGEADKFYPCGWHLWQQFHRLALVKL